MEVVGTRFGDRQSSLLDEFERLSFEAHAAQLSRVMLGRSLSEPKLQKSHPRLISAAPIPLVNQVLMQAPRHRGGGGGSGFHKVLKKLLKPFIGRKREGRKQASVDKDLLSFKAFSKSLRF
ncbi:hypothetical protein LR48_Vigan03g074400 [Vigna angularis]|uniref:Uncharacterized protein n=2 Tax=Phaseolus angularis TaxID=3914 RepID=A0A0L9U3U3_PHAAN|nr:hypothetical protein LR48_Vigan03g074400 [Vigna angularis]BAT83908.1 hypothetical protein VIGAN_04115000 [Vigna angularis var. angularis]